MSNPDFSADIILTAAALNAAFAAKSTNSASLPAAGPPTGTETFTVAQNGSEAAMTTAQFASFAQGVTANPTATEAIAAGAFVYVYSDGGTLGARNANAAMGYPANAFSPAAIATGVAAPVTFSGINTAVTVTMANTPVWLGVTNGSYSTTPPPSTAGFISQIIGIAIPGIGVLFTPNAWVIQ